MTPIAEGITTLEELAAALAVRRKQLGLCQRDCDDIAGLPFKYTGKVEAGAKGLGKLSIPCLLGALKCELVLMPATSQNRKNVSAPKNCETGADFFKRRAMHARKVQIAKTPPRKRRALAQVAARARWAKRAERERS